MPGNPKLAAHIAQSLVTDEFDLSYFQDKPLDARCYKMGQALRRAIESYPEDIKVAVVATGGLSHQVHGERAGFNNPEWDREFLDRITDDPASLTAMTHAEFATFGGLEGAEVIMWLVMRGALSDGVERVHSSYYLPSMTASPPSS